MKKNKMKLIDYLREQLPEDYIGLIAKNMDNPEDLNSFCLDPPESEVMTLFDWEDSREGYDFWNEVHLFLMDIGSLPEMPINIDYKPNLVLYCGGQMHIMNIGDTGLCFKYPRSILKSLNKEVKEKILGILN